MALIKSISGIRGTIGGKINENLTPVDVLYFVSAFCQFLYADDNENKIVIGRDARVSGNIIKNLAIQTGISMGFEVIDLDLTTTPTVEIAVKNELAKGGVIVTASHNDREWNALKLLNKNGEFIDEHDMAQILNFVEDKDFVFKTIDKLGRCISKNYLDFHIKKILEYPLIKVEKIKKLNLTIVVDAINSSGAIYIKELLEKLEVKSIFIINDDLSGNFAHNPEPLEKNLVTLKKKEVVEKKADLGISVDPDVDRLCFISEDGAMFGEEYTLVAIADYFLKNKKGSTVSNLSSTSALKDLTEKYNCKYFSSRVGELNVIKKMKDVNAVIGGEGNGGVIVPDFHYGRDALIGIALFLSYLADTNSRVSDLRKNYTNYFMYKTKTEINSDTDLKKLIIFLKSNYKNVEFNEEDGLKIIFSLRKEWIHIRHSNTEPILRIYAESKKKERCEMLAEQAKKIINIFL